jgi:probable HAF family extracellular repeat protein
MEQHSILRTAAAIIFVELTSIGSLFSQTTPTYAVIDLGILSGYSNSCACGINNKGQIVGYCDPNFGGGPNRSFLWQNGSMQDLGTGNYSEAYGINDKGQIVGNFVASNGYNHAFLWQNGSAQDLGTLWGPTAQSIAYSINDNGQVVGRTDGSYTHATLWQNGTNQDLGTYGGVYYNSIAYAINNNGQVVGYLDTTNSHAFLWQNGSMQDLGTTLTNGYGSSVAYAINNSTQIVGCCNTNYYAVKGFLWQNGSMQSLATTIPGFYYSVASGINNSGQIVGDTYYGTISPGVACLWQNGVIYNLNSLVIATNSGWNLEYAQAINDLGQIVGVGINPSGQIHAFLLNALPPGALYACTTSQPSLPSYGVCPTNEQGKDSLILITHGWINPKEQITPGPLATVAWVDSMSNSIAAYLTARGFDNWQVYGFKWLEGASQLLPTMALFDADLEGTLLGNRIAQGEWKHIHFIAHSAGAGLIQKATEQIKTTLTNTTIHCTFLDAYDGVVGEKAYEYGIDADWSDSYFVRDDFQRRGWTGRILPYAYNVGVTALDPQATTNLSGFVSGSSYNPSCNNILESNHGWPIVFYANSIAGVLAGGDMSSIYDGLYYDNFGLLLSEECGNWNLATNQYQPGNGVSYGSVTNLGPENGTCIPPYVLPPGYIGTAPAFSVVSSIKSVTGTIETWLGSVVLKTGSPAWIATVITDSNALNYVSFDAAFTSASGSDGLLSVYCDTNMIGLVDEAAVQPGFQHYNLSYPNTAPNTSHVLGFHLDPFTSVQSVVVITNIVTGYVGVSQPFSLSITTNTSNGLLVYQLTGQPANYTIMSSPDLVNWTNIAVLVNTNGTVNFVDPHPANSKMLFYRAMASSGMTE